MNDTLMRVLQSIPDVKIQRHLENALRPIVDRLSTQALASAGLEIAGTTTLAQIGASSTFHAVVKGKLITIAAGTDMPALSGTVTADAYNVFCFFVDEAGTVTSIMGTEGSTRALVKFPAFPESKALIGFVVINPTGTGNFVGGTTALGDATVVPNAQYISPLGPMDPRVLIS